MQDRRQFIQSTVAVGTALAASPFRIARAAGEPLFRISLAEWSLNRHLFGGELDNLEFPAFAKNTFGIEAVEAHDDGALDARGAARSLAVEQLVDLARRPQEHGHEADARVDQATRRRQELGELRGHARAPRPVAAPRRHSALAC